MSQCKKGYWVQRCPQQVKIQIIAEMEKNAKITLAANIYDIIPRIDKKRIYIYGTQKF